MRCSSSVKPFVLLLCACLLWVFLGCPLTGEEWKSAPQNVRQWMYQLPGRLAPMWRNWLLKGNAAAQAAPVDTLRVWNTRAGKAVEMPVEEYVVGVVAAEMPAVYHEEALKCQAIAARTRVAYAQKALGGQGCVSHPGCDVCTEPSCCQGWKSEPERRADWQGEASVYEKRIRAAVFSTAGEILTWEGLPIEMLYHACSGGQTEDASAVFAGGQPYLVSVESPGEQGYQGFESETTMSCAEAAALLCQAFPGCGVAAETLAEQLRLQETTSSGRIEKLLVGSTLVSGVQFRHALGLRSTLCTWSAENGMITFHTRGYGHGVGMSQAGAQAMAASGERYASILAHYYPGTVLLSLPAE